MQFNTEKHGYNKEEVDFYVKSLELKTQRDNADADKKIRALQEENASYQVKLNAYKNKEDMISKALIDAMARAKKIEENSRKIYELEIQKIRLLYNKYKALLEVLIENNACQEIVDSVTKNTSNLKSGINKVLNSQNERAYITQNADARMRELLTKMNNVVAERNSLNEDIEQESMMTKTNNIKPICKINLEKTDNFEDLVDKFLESDETESNAYAKQILNNGNKKSGFDLKEAINPTLSLEDIMKDFDIDD